MGSLRVRHDWVISLSLFTFMHWRRKWQPTPVFLPWESQGRGSLGHDWSNLAAAVMLNSKIDTGTLKETSFYMYGRAKLGRHTALINRINLHWKSNLHMCREDSTHGHHQMVNTEIRLIIFFAAEDGKVLYSQQKQDQELTVSQTINSLLPNSDLNWRK